MSTTDESDLDFTSLAEASTPPPVLRSAPTPAEDQEALIGSRSLGTEGFPLIAARRS